MPLSESELKDIREEAERLYPYRFFTGINGTWPDHTHNAIMGEKRQAYIFALTSEREKSKVLVDALLIAMQTILDLYPHCHESDMKGEASYEKAWLACEQQLKDIPQALDTYSKSIKP
jgi:hypothetical protein